MANTKKRHYHKHFSLKLSTNHYKTLIINLIKDYNSPYNLPIMINNTLFILLFFSIISINFACNSSKNSPSNNINSSTKHAHKNIKAINGISFESPPQAFETPALQPIIDDVGANWIAISPYAFARGNSPKIIYDSNYQWWGERPEGVIRIIEHAQAQGLKIMLKPQVWLMHSWVGDFDLEKEKDWKLWEESYRDYVIHFAHIADSMHVDLFCVGTEYRIAAVKRANYWQQLINEVKTIYTGPLTYAANWDNYQNIPFWSSLDYIGIDAYFPLDKTATPSIQHLTTAWNKLAPELAAYSQQYQKQLLFTEYGYMSLDQAGWQNWENEANKHQKQLNLQAQANAFEALFRSIWQAPYIAGGFIWKWHVNHAKAGGKNNKDYTPQNKPAAAVIKHYYTQNDSLPKP